MLIIGLLQGLVEIDFLGTVMKFKKLSYLFYKIGSIQTILIWGGKTSRKGKRPYLHRRRRSLRREHALFVLEIRHCLHLLLL